eukprot:NODE_6456_length_883_cov_30.931579_g5862_i0.p1 GENE.NODE_6456_length_883_cov_30.931579_g5862_i0~~NODE_6456_length_883_cov_30.931579_g5862_i0.p1  ORF type:complete len:260 (+),score=24.87 NODE_6456_length_883_cov_30.931579_g5862_i0:56-781(+)
MESERNNFFRKTSSQLTKRLKPQDDLKSKSIFYKLVLSFHENIVTSLIGVISALNMNTEITEDECRNRILTAIDVMESLIQLMERTINKPTEYWRRIEKDLQSYVENNKLQFAGIIIVCGVAVSLLTYYFISNIQSHVIAGFASGIIIGSVISFLCHHQGGKEIVEKKIIKAIESSKHSCSVEELSQTKLVLDSLNEILNRFDGLNFGTNQELFISKPIQFNLQFQGFRAFDPLFSVMRVI